MILDATGRAVVTKQILALTGEQVRWFLNGKAFLRHLGDLTSARLAAYCQQCYAQGRPDDVMAAKADADTYVIRCAHQQRTIPASQVRDTDELLARLGWSLRCDADCAKKGMFDGVQGQNDPQSQTIEIACGCTDRKYQLPTAGRA